MTDLSGKSVLITGAGQGIGQGVALAMAGAGARVAVTGRTLSKVETTAQMVRERGGTTLALACDVKSAADLAATVEATVGQTMMNSKPIIQLNSKTRRR